MREEFEDYETMYKSLEEMTINEEYVFIVSGKKKVYPNRYYGMKLLYNKEVKIPIDCRIIFDEKTNKYLLDINENICGCIEDFERFKSLLEKHNITKTKNLKCKVIGITNDKASLDYKILVEK